MDKIRIGARFTLVTKREHDEYGRVWWKVLCEVTAVFSHRFDYQTIDLLELSHDALRDDAPISGGVALSAAAIRVMRIEWQES